MGEAGQADSRALAKALDEATLGRFHLKAAVVSGMGFFTDAYDLFIIGIALVLIKSEWHLSSPEVSAVGASTLLGAFIGAMVLGRVADLFGRKRVYVLVAVIMTSGALASAFATSLVWLVAFRLVLGLGIGGDYPVSAVLMTEYSNQRDRGKLVSLVFAMQALGLVVGPLVGLTLIGSGIGHELAWRLMLGFGAIPATTVIWLRTRMPESPRYTAEVQGRSAEAAASLASFAGGKAGEPKSLPGHFGGESCTKADPVIQGLRLQGSASPEARRMSAFSLITNRRLLLTLVGTAGTWFLLDYALYGNTISTPLILADVAPRADLMAKLAWTLIIFVAFAVPGYVLALYKMDKIGHRKLQIIGFTMMAVSFALLAAVPQLTAITSAFIVVYGLSYFFSEFGPNTTTFVLPAELFPTGVRTTGHGVSAGVAKLGAFLGVFMFPILESAAGLRGSLAVTASASLAGLLLTMVLPEPARLSLDEIADGHPRVEPAGPKARPTPLGSQEDQDELPRAISL